MRFALAASVLLGFSALAQEAPPPSEPPVFATPEEQAPVPMEASSPARTPLPAGPPPAAVQPPPPDEPYVAPTYSERCFAVPARAWVAHPTTGRYYVYGSHHLTLSGPVGGAPAAGASGSNFHGAAPVGQAPPVKGGSSGGGSSGGGLGDLGKAVLILAVVAVAILPIIVYAVDGEAPPVVDARFHCPSFGLDLYGGADLPAPGVAVAGTGTGRLSFGWGYFGADAEFSYASSSLTQVAAHIAVRFAPKAHIEPSLAIGYRSIAYRGGVLQGFEVGVPHRYVFYRDNLRQFALELRPSLLLNSSSVNAGLEGALIVPIVEPVHLRFGARVLSFGEELLGGVNLGVSLNL